MQVALLAEGVDRNFLELVYSYLTPVVALLAEGVDRNPLSSMGTPTCMVALLAEGVDRNCLVIVGGFGVFQSPSSRRAWIEIHQEHRCKRDAAVALLAEGVDRN